MKRILVVDDEADLLAVTLLRLRKTGYEIFGAVDGQEALDLAREKMPDLIVLDIFLPVMNGDEVAKILKKDEKLKHIPIILISADTKFLEETFGTCGAQGCLAKPFDSAKLIEMIKRFTESGNN